MKYLLLTIISVFFFSCKSVKITQEINRCQEGAPIEVLKRNSLFFKKKNHFMVMFMDGFDGNTQLFVNNELVFDKNIKTDFSTSYADMTDFTMSGDAILKIQTDATTNNCIEFEMDRRYRAVLVYRFDDEWSLRFSNQKVYYSQ